MILIDYQPKKKKNKKILIHSTSLLIFYKVHQSETKSWFLISILLITVQKYSILLPKKNHTTPITPYEPNIKSYTRPISPAIKMPKVYKQLYLWKPHTFSHSFHLTDTTQKPIKLNPRLPKSCKSLSSMFIKWQLEYQKQW